MKIIACMILASSVIATASAQSFVNPGFEDPSLATNTYTSNPTSPGWTGINDWGIANGKGPWGVMPHGGNQYAFIQRGSKPAAYISQRVKGLTVGVSYHIKFSMACRHGNVGADYPNPIAVLVDGGALMSATTPPEDGTWLQYTTPDFVATGTAATIKFVGKAAGGDRSSLLDDLIIEPSTTLPPPGVFRNGTFEDPRLFTNQWVQAPRSTDLYWQGTLPWGIANGSASWGRGGYEGSQYAYIASDATAGSIYQTVTGLVPGQVYSVRFGLARRNGNVGGNYGSPIKVMLDDATTIYPYTTPSSDGAWTITDTSMFLATKDSYKFTWQTANSTTQIGSATLIDKVTLNAIGTPPAPFFPNRKFDKPRLPDGTSAMNPANPGVFWEGSGWGVANGLTSWGNGGVNGSQYAFVQSTVAAGAGHIQCKVDDLVIGQTYRVVFSAALRPGKLSRPNHLTVMLGDGTVLLADVTGPSTGEWTKKATATFVALSSSVVLKFQGSVPTTAQPDATTLIDEVAIVRG